MPDERQTRKQRDRELGEMLQELRVALPGVQVLFAFLLTVPFTQRYKETLGTSDRVAYMVAVVSTALASVLLIAPAASHRLLFRTGTRERLLRTMNHIVIAGFAFLTLGIALSVYVVASVVYGTGLAVVLSVALTAVTVLLWFVVPEVLHREERERESGDGADG